MSKYIVSIKSKNISKILNKYDNSVSKILVRTMNNIITDNILAGFCYNNNILLITESSDNLDLAKISGKCSTLFLKNARQIIKNENYLDELYNIFPYFEATLKIFTDYKKLISYLQEESLCICEKNNILDYANNILHIKDLSNNNYKNIIKILNKSYDIHFKFGTYVKQKRTKFISKKGEICYLNKTRNLEFIINNSEELSNFIFLPYYEHTDLTTLGINDVTEKYNNDQVIELF